MSLILIIIVLLLLFGGLAACRSELQRIDGRRLTERCETPLGCA
jgi:hypothetical protein